ncbi:uncharacterized protein V6R79_015290 [Siganus canaliculatus]
MAAVVAQSYFIFGLRTGVKNNLCFLDDRTVVYPCGNNCVCYNFVERSQRFIPGTETSQGMHALAISANHRYLAVSESGDKAVITVFDLQHEHGRKRKVLTAGDVLVQEFVYMAFSPDSKYLVGQAAGPEGMLIFWLWEKQKVLATVRTSNANNSVTQVSFNPYNNMQLCATGTGVFKLFRYSEGALKQSTSAKVESIKLLCHTWMTAECVIAGTDTGRLLLFESGRLRREIHLVSKTEQEQVDRQVEMEKFNDTDAPEGPAATRITAIASYSKGFACSFGAGRVCLFEKNQEDSYSRSREIQIPSHSCSNELTLPEFQEIDTICISPAEETLAISTDRGQLYSFSLSTVDRNKEKEAHFELLSQSFHSKPITGLSVCIRKPLVATSSLDRSVRIWNYETRVLELCKEFQEEAYCVALHPTGLFILVGFSDKLRLMSLLIDDICISREFTVRGCRECAFSHGGHLFAAVNGNVIHIYSVTSFENIVNLTGHIGKVRAIRWSQDDRRLVSCGMDGAVYEWNTQTGKRESESVLKSCSYTDVDFSANCETFLVVGSDFTLKEIQDCQVLREVPADEVAHTAVAVSHSGRAVFTGTSAGTIRAIKYPLPTLKEWVTFQGHCSPVTKMAVTFDEQFLLSASEDGCLLMWRIVDREGRGLKSNRQIIHTEEILVTKSDLDEKIQKMLDLKMRLEEMQMEKEYQLRLKDICNKEKMKELSDQFMQQIESLKTVQQAMKTEMEKQERELVGRIEENTAAHSRELNDLELSSSQKLTVEHEMYQNLQRKYQRMQGDYEKQLKAAEDSRVQGLEELTQKYESELQEKTQLLAQCQEDAQQQICELKEIVKQVEEDEERMIHNIRIKYERKLHSEKQTNASLKGEACALTQEFGSLQRQIDGRCSDMNKLKQERQRLLGLVRSLESDTQELKRQISGLEKTNLDKDRTISSLKKKNQELEKLKFVLDFQFNALKKEMEPQRDDLNQQKEQIHQLKEELAQVNKSNSQLTLTTSDLRLKLKSRQKEIQKEVQKVNDLETHLQRLKADLQNCVSLIQEPKKLKDSVQMMYGRYVTQTGVVEKGLLDEDAHLAVCGQRDHLERTVNCLNRRLAKSAEEHNRVFGKMMKENVTLIAEINELRVELRSVTAELQECKAELATTNNPKKPAPNPEDGARQGKQQM